MTSQTAQGRSRAGASATGTPAETVLQVSDLRMNYGSTEVLKGVDLTARRGEVIALLGPNGAGKTTTIEILEGFRRRSAGDVDVLGSDPDHGDEEWRSRLGPGNRHGLPGLLDRGGDARRALPRRGPGRRGYGVAQLPLVAGVLTLWTVVGFLVAQAVLRRMARRTSGSRVQAAREEAMKRAY